MRLQFIVLTAAAALAFATTAEAQDRCAQSRDLRLTNGRIHTMDRQSRVVDEVTIQDGRFAFVGRADPRRLDPCTRVINLRGRTVIPGLIDNHNHIVALGLRPGYHTPLENAFSLADVASTVRGRAKSVPAGSFITSLGGWNARQFREKRAPTMAELDAAAPNHAVLIYPSGGGPGGPATGHANSRAKAYLQSRGVAIDPEGIISGPAFTAAIAALRADQTFDDEVRGTLEATTYTASLGLTTQVDQGFTILRGTPDVKTSLVNDHGLVTFSPWTAYDAFRLLHEQNRMKTRLRIFWYTRDTEVTTPLLKERLLNTFVGFGDDMLRTSGVGETIVSEGLAKGAPPNYEPALQLIAKQGWPYSQHTLTLAEDKVVTDTFERVNRTTPIANLRWSISHAPRIDLETINRLKAMGAGIEAHAWSYLNGQKGAGPPFRMILDSGIRAGGGSDAANVTTINPWLMIYYMVTGKNSAGELVNDGQQITRQEALRMYTADNGWFFHEEDTLGSIETGKLGDLVVLSDDYFDPKRVADEGIKSLKSVLTVIGGTIVHDAMR